MVIKTKRWDEDREPSDGFRLLITRYRPRGLRKEDETWDAWNPDLGPSRELLARFKGKVGEGIGWATYRRLYVVEMQKQKAAIAELARRATAGETITLLCASSCLRESRCHRSVLKELIEKSVIAR